MCGIFAYLNYLTPQTRQKILDILIGGLKRLEYRGYDSAGVGIDNVSQDHVVLVRKKGKVANLKNAIESMKTELYFDEVTDGHVGIAHTRWATHGAPSEVNSHPQRSGKDNRFVVVHNGIITNNRAIRKFLTSKGYEFESETDTESIAKLLDHLYVTYPHLEFLDLIHLLIPQLEGAFACFFKSSVFPRQMVAAKRGSPLLVGIRTEDMKSSVPVNYSRPKKIKKAFSLSPNDKAIEYFLASDASALVEHTKRVLYLEDNDIVAFKDGAMSVHCYESETTEGNEMRMENREIITLDMELQQIQRGNYSTFMQKEIFEQPDSVFNTMRGRVDFKSGKVVLGGIADFLDVFDSCKRFILLGCGTSYHSAVATRQVLEEMTQKPVCVELAGDFHDRQMRLTRDDVCIFISQSGETADTLEALNYCKDSKVLLTVGITNTVGSTISRRTDCGIHINAGPEIAVASTKAYTSQIIALVLFAWVLGRDQIKLAEKRKRIINGLKDFNSLIKRVLEQDLKILELAQLIKDKESMFVTGRGYNLATCLEAALKIKEIAYIQCTGIQTGELKHGPLALISDKLPVLMVIMRHSDSYHKSMTAYEEVKTKGGKTIVMCLEDDKETIDAVTKDGVFYIPVPRTEDVLQGIINIIPMQLLSYHLAVLRGNNVDCPRNLAKSVTVG